MQIPLRIFLVKTMKQVTEPLAFSFVHAVAKVGCDSKQAAEDLGVARRQIEYGFVISVI